MMHRQKDYVREVAKIGGNLQSELLDMCKKRIPDFWIYHAKVKPKKRREKY